jgi:signal transduction histidine kinase
MRSRGHLTAAAWRERAGPDFAWHDQMLNLAPERRRMSARARLLAPVVISLVLQAPGALFFLIRQPNPMSVISGVVLMLAIVGPLALLAARRFPGPVVVFMTAAACADFLLADPMQGPPYFSLAFAIGGAIVRGARIWAWVSVGIGWIVTLLVGILSGLDWHPARIAATTLGVLVVFGIGEAIRTRRENFDRYRGAVLQRRQTEVQAERVRIARELHDVLAHSLSQINVQASVGLHLMDKQPALAVRQATEALASIKETSKTALDEVRAVLGVLRAENGADPQAPLVPEPDLSRLPGLAASVTSQGVEVAIENRVDSAPKAVQLALYRIVQESLTNVVRHAHATQATVNIGEDDKNYTVSIGDNGVGLHRETESSDSNGGRGMLGMQERAELLGGMLTTGSSAAGGLLVTATIPRKEALE